MADGNVNSVIYFLQNVSLPFNESENKIDECIQSFRVLRNYCANGKREQDYVVKNQNLMSKSKLILNSLIDRKTQKEQLCFYIALQFLANSLVDNKENQVIIWASFSDILLQCLNSETPKVQNCAAMMIYNLFINDRDLLLSFTTPCVNVLQMTQNEETVEYSVFILELLMSHTDYVARNFATLDCYNRMILLGIIESMHNNTERKKFHSGMIPCLANYFVTKCQRILSPNLSGMLELEAQEVAKILDVLNSVSSSNSDYMNQLQNVEELLVAVIGLLRIIHNLSKQQGNQFSMLLKMADLEAENSNIQEHPGFGFKASLVRLIGNMCWHNKKHQDTTRELGAIPLLLDCSNIDARNPLIIQWVVLAMRNLCENNVDNQRVVASVDQKGEVDRERLADLGLLFNGAGR